MAPDTISVVDVKVNFTTGEAALVGDMTMIAMLGVLAGCAKRAMTTPAVDRLLRDEFGDQYDSLAGNLVSFAAQLEDTAAELDRLVGDSP
jgi:hypothetical protein